MQGQQQFGEISLKVSGLCHGHGEVSLAAMFGTAHPINKPVDM
jgi:hypothetical protein